MVLVAILTIRITAKEMFRTFEHGAAEVMARHGGAIERTVVIPPEEGADLFKEIHFVRFPDAASFDAYRSDQALTALAPLREASIVATTIMIGEDGPTYGRSVEQSGDRG